MLPTMAQAMTNGQFIPAHHRPKSKFCKGCGASFGRPLRDGNNIKGDVCKPCRAILKDDATIFVSASGRRAIVTPKPGSDSAIAPQFRGRIVQVPEDWLDKLIGCGQVRESHGNEQ